MTDFDITIIGGGINGTAIARDAAGRGLRVLLVEQHDLASGTSWASTKLIHGGLRYLEQYAFRMVQEALHERTTLLKMAPHIIWPSRFILPHHSGLRPAWLLRIGLFIYDALAGKNILPTTRTVDLTKDETGTPLQPHYRKAFEYSDCGVDDARFVVLNAVDAAERGAIIKTRTHFDNAVRQNNKWLISYTHAGVTTQVTSHALINAAGPWVEEVGRLMPKEINRAEIKLVKGSHIVVPRLFLHNKSYIFQNADGRIVFAIPYQNDFTLIGTTEVNVTGNPTAASISDDEINYLCNVANDYFQKSITSKDVVWTFAGVRALYDSRSLSAKDLSRDYLLMLDGDKTKPPLLTIYGGKLTAARRLAEAALEKLTPLLSMKAAWTAHSTLPGGNFAWNKADELVQKSLLQWPFLSKAHAWRLVRAYGTRIQTILGNAKSMTDCGKRFGEDLTEAEVKYLMQHEWAQTADDILWLRSKLGLRFTAEEKERLASYMAGNIYA
ncbi:MAG: glycerol-3-phosphate dehydrogenase [Alphaproteobacteria bacterium]|nr:glycerol-3-phosphate dehydrogenase [Alphaproteobacteria bacterium]